ncbi:P-loop containing nucleoside triphosphate hydrolase protein [Baffinella frigidus]|nr:P-loop containing nucleoside triphosphate hydrolase protein [Cryptophyta sp. CCMP2293]
MTVRETLRFSARLRLPKTMPLEDKYANVEEIITKLSLGKCADSIVGGAKVRGISGGERKRLNIGCELIGSPSLLFLDEPTTGLDSFQAEKVVASLRALADLGHTVVCVIHQPSGAVFNTFDDLLLLYAPAVGTVAPLHPCPGPVLLPG